jgi:coenzyme F420-reducing hydrogenase beta subunit
MPSTELALSPALLARSGLCVGCGACVGLHPDLRLRLDRYGQFRPDGPGAQNAAADRVCPFSPSASNEDQIGAERFPDAPHVDARIGRFEAAYFGHSIEGNFRKDGSSGGLTSWMACELLRRGIVDAVVHVGSSESEANEPLFGYRISRTEVDVRRRAKSRYFPVEISGVLEEIRNVPGRYAIVGIPCFIKAVHLARAADQVLSERILYTLGLVCGHMKSARFAESLAWQLNCKLKDVQHFDFRHKDPSRPANWYRAEVLRRDGEVRSEDWWHLVDGDWGAGFFQNAACDVCDDVVGETADISFGDAWIDPYQEDGRGTNVVIVRDKALHKILLDGMGDDRVALLPADANTVVRTQAAGFRQRREGLAYRLIRRRTGIKPLKRIRPAGGLSLRRRAVYALRQRISRWSHRIFWLARSLRWLALYRSWARLSLYLYQSIAHSKGSLGASMDRLFGPNQR